MKRAVLPLAVLAVVAPLLVLPSLFGSQQSAACTPTPRLAFEIPAGSGLDAGQLANAAVIVEVASRMSLDDAASVIGVMTALTESSLRNVAHGDSAGPDSRGLFQQRDGWGPLEMRMSPSGSSRLFFDALVAVPGWMLMEPWIAAQSVQRSAFAAGDNYEPNHHIARQVVASVVTAGAGRPVTDCAGSFALPMGNEPALPGAAAAVSRAHAMVGRRGYHQLCARLASHIWGRTHSGYASAAEQWDVMVASGNSHASDRRPPVGAVLFWSTDGPFGHVAVYVGGGQIVSNDIGDTASGAGGVYLVDVVAIESQWGATYLGWAPPIYTAPTA